MNPFDEVIFFGREYINVPQSRTPAKRKLIKNVYEQLTGDTLNATCGSCYIAAIITIFKNKKMKPCDYVLKPGAILQAFGDSGKIATNKNLTNELAEWHLKNIPGSIKKFAKIPAGVVIPEFTGITILPKSNIVAPEKIIIPEAVIIPEVKVEEVKAEVVEPEIIVPKKSVVKKTRKRK